MGAYAIVTDAASRILLTHIRSGYPAEGNWTLPGGGVEHGEHPDDAVMRELREETGLTGVRGPVASIWSGLIKKPARRPGPLHWIAILYRVAVRPGELRVEQDGSTDTAAWFRLDEIPGIPHVDLVDGAVEVLTAPPGTP